MFSLVTALVSPCVIDTVGVKKEVLITALQENAGVICSHPADSVCLLQGDWDNVKKAYAIIEEFYLRTQAESVVRRMLKIEPGTEASQTDFTSAPRNLVGGRIPPDQVLSLLLSPPPTDEGEHSATTSNGASKFGSQRSPPNSAKSSNSDNLVSLARQCRSLTTSSALNGILPHLDDIISKTRDDSPPVLSREDMSSTSESSESQDIDLYAASLSQMSGPEITAAAAASAVAAGTLNNNLPSGMQSSSVVTGPAANVRDGAVKGQFAGYIGARPAASEMNGTELPMSKEAAPAASALTPSPHRLHLSSVSSSGNDRDVGVHSFPSPQILHRATPQTPQQQSHQQQQHFVNSNSESRLPQFSSLFSSSLNSGTSGNSTVAATSSSLSSTWPYAAEFYSAHLSAMRSICEATVKRESNLETSDFAMSRNAAAAAASSAGGYPADDDPLGSELRCSRCGKTYRSEARMREHARTHDAGYVAVLHSCPKCGKAFTYRHNMVVHLRRFHYGWQPAKRHACRTCGMRFQKPYLLRLHERKAHLAGPVDSGQFTVGPSHSSQYPVRE